MTAWQWVRCIGDGPANCGYEGRAPNGIRYIIEAIGGANARKHQARTSNGSKVGPACGRVGEAKAECEKHYNEVNGA